LNSSENHGEARISSGNPESETSALIQILMQIPDDDRRELAKVVERWHKIGPELRKAVLAVVASGDNVIDVQAQPSLESKD
jgi:hypothetical protein